MTIREKILEKIKEVPAFPSNTARILNKINNKESQILDIAREIELDPTLTANILKLANSAYFAGPKKISTIREAVVLLGINRIQQMIIASAIFPTVVKPLRGYDLPAGELIRHLVGTAIASELLSKELKIDIPPYTFTVGLLHDIGKIVLGTFIEIDAEPILKKAYEEKVSFEKAEKEILGIDHSEIGALLMQEWHFPNNLVQPILYHHDPDNAPEEYRLVTDFVHIASNLCLECGIGSGIDGLNYSNNPNSIERLKIDMQVVETVLSKLIGDIDSFMGNLKSGDIT
ncbi:MAG TPA: HDOD domain-containing protein [Candidatus Hydrogenedens sp.]|mgnify:CR=1 FL=1|nr:HDOD domain-containing protein [Candidatus Hydrogenedens sp.]